MKGRDFALLTDLYELTMMQGYYETGAHKRQVVFDLFYRKNPSGNGYAIAAGLQQAIEYLDGLHFSDEDIAYLESLNIFTEQGCINGTDIKKGDSILKGYFRQIRRRGNSQPHQP